MKYQPILLMHLKCISQTLKLYNIFLFISVFYRRIATKEMIEMINKMINTYYSYLKLTKFITYLTEILEKPQPKIDYDKGS